MNDSLFSTKDMVKYIIVGGLVYAILKMIPSVQLANKDLMLLLAIITVGFVCLDCLFLKKSEGFANNDPFTLDLDTDINELIKQRQAKRKDSRKETVSSPRAKITPEEAEREKILSRLDEKRRKASDPVEETKKEIKKLDEKIASAFSGADAEKARKAKVELEAKLEILKAKEITPEEEERIAKVREERADKPRRRTTPEEKRVFVEEKRIAEEEQVKAIRSKRAAEEKIVKLEEKKANAIKRGDSSELRALAEEIKVTTKAKVIAEERVVVAEKRKDTISKKLADIPVDTEEEQEVANEERVIADARVKIADELKTIAEKRGSSSDLKQIVQEQKEAVVAKLDAEDKLEQVKERRDGRVARIESENIRGQIEERRPALLARIESEDIRGQIEERRPARVEIDERIKLPEQDYNEDENVSRALPKTSCGLEVEKIKRQMQDEMAELKEQLKARSAIPPSSAKIANKYFESLMNDLADKGILDANEIDNIQSKLRSKLLSMDEVIASLETLKKEGKAKVRVQDGKVKHDREYSELPSDFYTPIGQQVPNDWTSEYTILNTNKWQVPMPRPPVCINTQPCKVCPSDTSNYPVNLKQWDDSRYVTGGRINKKWADDQTSA